MGIGVRPYQEEAWVLLSATTRCMLLFRGITPYFFRAPAESPGRILERKHALVLRDR